MVLAWYAARLRRKTRRWSAMQRLSTASPCIPFTQLTLSTGRASTTSDPNDHPRRQNPLPLLRRRLRADRHDRRQAQCCASAAIPSHPANFGRVCPKGGGVAQTVNVPTRAALRDGARRGLRPPADRSRRPRPSAGRPRGCDRILQSDGPGAIALLPLRPAHHRSPVPGQQVRQGLPAHQPRRQQQPAVHGQRGQRAWRCRWAATARRAATPTSSWPTRFCSSAPTPPTATRSPSSASRSGSARGRKCVVVDPRRTRDRRGGHDPPARPARHRPGAAERPAAAAARLGQDRPRLHRRPHRRLGGARRAAGRIPAGPRGGGLRHRRAGLPRRRPAPGRPAPAHHVLDDGRQPDASRARSPATRSSTCTWRPAGSAGPAAGRSA